MSQANASQDNTNTNTTSQVEDTSLEDMEISLDEVDESSTEESVSDDSSDDKSSDESDDDGEVEDETTDKSQDDEQSDEEEQDDGESKDSLESRLSPEEKRRLNQEYAQRRIAEKKLRDMEKQRENDVLHQYIQEASDDEILAQQRMLEVEAFRLQNEKSEVLEEKASVQIDRALANIELFSSGSEAVKNMLADSLDDFEASYVVRDQFDRIVELKQDPYEYLQKQAQRIETLLSEGALKQTKAKSKEAAKTVTLPIASQAKQETDEDLDSFDAYFGK